MSFQSFVRRHLVIGPVYKETTQNRKLMKKTNEVEGQRFVRFIAAYIKLK